MLTSLKWKQFEDNSFEKSDLPSVIPKNSEVKSENEMKGFLNTNSKNNTNTKLNMNLKTIPKPKFIKEFSPQNQTKMKKKC